MSWSLSFNGMAAKAKAEIDEQLKLISVADREKALHEKALALLNEYLSAQSPHTALNVSCFGASHAKFDTFTQSVSLSVVTLAPADRTRSRWGLSFSLLTEQADAYLKECAGKFESVGAGEQTLREKVVQFVSDAIAVQPAGLGVRTAAVVNGSGSSDELLTEYALSLSVAGV